jgi:RNA polymerase sigma-70 factor (ECF subfamily)
MSQSDPINGVEFERPLSDEELVRLAQQGSLEAFTGLYKRYLPTVYNRVRYVVPEQDVEDVTQEVFIALIKSLKSFKGEAQFGTWLRTLTNRRVADYYRKREQGQVQLDVDLSEVAPGLSPQLRVASQTGALDDRMILREALRALPEHYQEIILFRFAEGLPFNEIACQRGQSLEATKSLFRRAIAALRNQVEARNG